MKGDQRLLRIGMKLLDCENEFAFKCSILVPVKHHVVNSLFQEYNLKNCHARLQTIKS